MSAAKHTPESWTLRERRPTHDCFGPTAIEILVCAGDGNPFAIVSLGGPGATRSNPEDVRANARLIAAAPELLEALVEANLALEFFFSQLDETDDPKEVVRFIAVLVKARAAIAKAGAA